jgi:endo-1,4-beta-xylanase
MPKAVTMTRPLLASTLLAAFPFLYACGGGSDGGGVPSPTPSATPYPPPATVANPDPLKDAALVSGRLIGTAVQSGFLSQSPYHDTYVKHFNYVTAEWEMKWDPIQKTRGVFDFSGGDAIVDHALGRGIAVKGHALIWHNATPAWVNGLSTEELRAEMRIHIETVVKHFKGRVVAWDVVNEAVADSGTALRDTVFLQKLGPGYIAEAFEIAHQADPGALLIYNDYSGEGRGSKSDRIYSLVKELKDSGVPIHGVGLQAHLSGSGYPSRADMTWNMQRLADLGLLVNVSELDIRVASVATDRWERQKVAYKDVTAACMAVANCHAITLWGFTDRYSWIDTQFGADDPLPFDENYQAKPAFFGIQEAFLGR